jgi:16S rRNA (guanine527-N7)-methyltransferase
MNIDELSTLSGRDVSRETFNRLSQLVDIVTEETTRQNLIAASTLAEIWQRHVVDSIQLLQYSSNGPWLDLGTGAGFPGLVIAIFDVPQVTLVEERRLRHEFLSRAAGALGLANVTVMGDRLERIPAFPAVTISARAFAPLDKIFSLSSRFADRKTRWILPKGKKAAEELESVRATWHGSFRLEASMTDPASSIIIAQDVHRKGRR